MPSRDEWIAAGTAALAGGGEQAIRVDRLAATLGVTKGSFHHHFRGARAIRLAVLDAYERDQLALVESVRAESARRDAPGALELLSELIGRLPGDSLERSVRAWATTDDTAGAVQARVDTARLGAIEAVWLRIVPASHARTAALVPLLAMIGASASALLKPGERDAVLRLLAGLAPHAPAVLASTQDAETS